MGTAARTKLGAALLLGLFVFAILIWLSDQYVESEYRHVEVGVSNVAGIVRIDVNCRRAATLGAGDVPRRIDLGDLSLDDRIYLSVYDKRGAAAWGLKIFVNGREARDFSSGHAGVTGRRTGPYGVGMAQMIGVDGDPMGTIGCGSPKFVSTSLANYQQAPEMRAMLRRGKAPPRWEPPRFPFALIGALDDWLPLLASVGWAAAVCIARVRRLIRRHRGVGFAVGALNLFLGLSKSVGPEVLLVWFTGVGLVLLLVSAVTLAWPHTGSPWPTGSSTPDPKPNLE